MKKLALSLAILATLTACSESTSESPTAALHTQSNNADKATSVIQDYQKRDIKDEVFYFVLPDRFNNANPDNDNGSTNIQISQGGLDPSSKWAFHGGDMQGLEQKLDYLQGMGVTAIWMTPIFRNQAIQSGGFGHHGYWIVDFTQIDPHFGSNQDLKNLINAAHKKNIKVFFDIITNHTADIIRYRECHNPDGTFIGENSCQFKSTEQVKNGDTYTPFIPQGLEAVKSPAWLNDPKYYNNQGDSFWQGESAVNGDFAGLDDLNTRLPEVVNGMIDIYKNVITEFKPDGFRIDTVKHVDMPFWQAFAPAILQHAEQQGINNFHIFGEVYGGDPALLSNYTTKGQLPSVLDFGFQHAAAEVFYRDKSPEVIATLFNNDDYYNDHDSHADLLMNFLGNHDMGRAGFFINQNNPIEHDTIKLQRSILSHAFMYLSRGIPVIYYGDEQGFTGDGGDVDARENIFPSKVAVYNDNTLIGTNKTTADDNFDTEHPLYLALKDLADLRAEHKALRHGITVNRGNNAQGAFAFSRIDSNTKQELLIAFNPSKQAATISVPANGSYSSVINGGKFDVKNDTLTLQLEPMSYTVLKNDTQLQPVTNLTVSLAGVETVPERTIINFKLDGEKPGHAQLLSLKVEALDEQGGLTLLAEDDTFPYRLVIHPDEYKALKGKKLKLTVFNGHGKHKSHEVIMP